MSSANDLSSANNTVTSKIQLVGFSFSQMTFSCKFYVDFAGCFMPLGLQKALEVCSISNTLGLKYDDPPLPEAENSMAHPIGKAENIAPTGPL